MIYVMNLFFSNINFMHIKWYRNIHGSEKKPDAEIEYRRPL